MNDFKHYSRLNNLVGWIIFGVAAITYLLTMERTVSLWDTGEFISSAYKLQVPHPPGAPMFTMIYRLFAMLAPSKESVPLFTNAASALASAFTILFLFWNITALAIKMLVKEGEGIDKGNLFAILGAGAVGALAYTFSDTFWFSAVESEVYAMSSMFTAMVFWLAQKWERRVNEPDNLKWIVLIFYLTGVVIGIHLLGILVIPIVVLMYYYKKYPNPTTKGLLAVLGLGVLILLVIQYGIIQIVPKIAATFDRIFANSFGLPLWSGVIFFLALLLAAIIFGINYSHKHGKRWLNLGIISGAMLCLGYGSYSLSVIRANADPSIDMADVEDVYSLISYVSREQYGDNPLVKGPYYTAYTKEGGITGAEEQTMWRRTVDRSGYEETSNPQPKYEYNSKYVTLFPRMFNATQENYIDGYKYWGDIKNDNKISFVGNNLNFFATYQMRYMYWRYFSWNFLGRQNDLQGFYDNFHQGNWITGIGFIDEIFGAGPQSNLPGYLKNNKARNTLFALPFILGLIGMVYHANKGRKDFFTVLFFFFMTGIAIALYLNMPAHQPRERDYAFVGSFYVFAIWIGLGVLGIYAFMRKRMAGTMAAGISTSLCLVAVPLIMGIQEWDDHDRSNRTAASDYGKNYLESCAPNAVLFCNGDNDTYPLWYAQEVEGYRDDVRVINLSLFGTDWYVNSMRHAINNADTLSFTFTPTQTRDWEYMRYDKALAARLFPRQDVYADFGQIMNYVGDKKNWQSMEGGSQVPYLPTQKFSFPINKTNVIKSGGLNPSEIDSLPTTINFNVNKSTLYKPELMLLDFIYTNNWKRPIYFSATSGAAGDYPYLLPYVQLEGLCFRLTPYGVALPRASDDYARVSTQHAYPNMMNKFKWGKLDENEVLVDFQMTRQTSSHRQMFVRLVSQLNFEGKKDLAVKALDQCFKAFPERNVPYDLLSAQLVRGYYDAGAPEKALPIATRIVDVMAESLAYYSKVKPGDRKSVAYEIEQSLAGIDYIREASEGAKQTDLTKRATDIIAQYQSIRVQQPQQ